ncbi:redox-sensing transcriptional repressor Rex [Candidatus Avelusimicrobium alvi]|uniref:redox-sensing transcriptional repressor Rex n=1 Tax=Candidatus Avelusimicrobium alvi TaxID=3416221 RepID=UPI003D1233C1
MSLFHRKKDISIQTIRRLPQYLRIFYNLHAYGRELVSSTALAEETQLLPIVIKKDLQAVGAPSKLRAGFKVAGTIAVIEKFLGWNNLNKAFLVGVGHLGAALLGFDGFKNHGLEIVAAFDTHPEKVGSAFHGVQVYHTAQLASVIEKQDLRIAVLTVPASAAQGITDTLVAAGIKAIWNFAPVNLTVPPGVVVQKEDISSGLAELCAKLKSK